MKKNLQAILVLVLALGMAASMGGCPMTDDGEVDPALVVMSDGGTTGIYVQNIGGGVTGGDPAFCKPAKPDEWHFVLNGLNPKDAAPGQMTAIFAEGTVVIGLAELVGGPTSGAAHYRLGGYLNATLLSGYAELSVNATYIAFVLSHAPCGAPPLRYSLTVSSTAGGSVTAPGEGSFTYDEGTMVGLEAAADEGYQFVKWVGGPVDGVTAPGTSITMEGDYSITAIFAEEEIPPTQHSLTISSTAGGSVTAPGEGSFTYDEGTVVALEAAAAEGYQFVKWVGGPIDGVTDPETSITMEGDYSITAIFAEEEIPITPITPTYALRVSSTEGGSATSPGEGTFSYPEGRVVRLVAHAHDGYKFAGWSGDVGTVADVNAAATAVTMQGHYSITATFEPETSPLQYNLTVSSTTGGSVTIPGEGTFTYGAGTVVNLVAKSEEGYRFAGWTGDVDTIALGNAVSTTITMHGDYRISANFEDGAWGTGVSVMGVTKEVDSAILPEAAVILYRNGEAVANAISDEHGIYALTISGPGDYEVVASKEGFADEVQLMSLTEPTTGAPDFLGDHGLIPAAPSTSYVLSCISLWKFGEWPFQLSTSKVLEVISAWVYR